MSREAASKGAAVRGRPFHRPVMRLNRRYIVEITDGLVPALQRRGLTRSEYSFDQFRDNLLEF